MNSATLFHNLELNLLKRDSTEHTFIHKDIGTVNTTLLDLATTYNLNVHDLLKMSSGCKSQVEGWRIVRK